MLVHAYLTDGFVPMAEVFLQSLHKVMPDPPDVWLDTRDLTEEQINRLRQSYVTDTRRLHIVNQTIPWEQWAQRADVSVKTLRKYKQEIEGKYVRQNNRVWKLMTAGDNRVRALHDLLELKAHDYIAHFDIDTLFRRELRLEGLMREANIWLKLREGHSTLKARITIDCLLLKSTPDVLRFFEHWREHIDRVPPPERPVGFGQLSCWYAFEEVRADLQYAQLPLTFGLPGRNAPDDIVWTGNVHRLAKDDCVDLFKEELRK